MSVSEVKRMLQRAGVWIGAVLLACAALPAEQPFPLRGLDVEGAEHFSKEKVIALTGLELGRPAGPADFQKAIERLGEAGVFETIEYRYGPKGDGYEVVFKVGEIQQLYPVRLEGFNEPEEKIFEYLAQRVPLFGERVPPTGRMAERIGEALQEYWRESGGEEEVIGRLAPIGDDQLAMLYQPDVARKNIAFVYFENVEALDWREVQRIFSQAAMGEPYSDTRLLELLHHNVRPLYETVGRMDVKFEASRVEPDPDSQGLLVWVTVDEGPQFVYGKVEKPDAPGLDPAQAEKLFAFQPGEPVNMSAVRRAQAAIDEAYRRQGFMKVESKLDAPVDKGNRTVDLTLSVEPGSQYLFGRLVVKGLDILAEPVIRRRWALKPGDPYNPAYADLFIERIEREQMFDNLSGIKADQQIDESRRTVDVTLSFLGGERKDGPPDAVKRPDIFF